MGTRLSPGVWRTNAGKTVQSQTDPDKSQPSKKADAKKPAKAAPAGPPVATPQVAAPQLPSNANLNTAAGAINAGLDVAGQTAAVEDRYNRIDQSTPFGSQKYSVDPVTGRTVVNQTLADDQEQIRQGDSAISRMGRDLASQNLQGSGLDKAFDPKSQDFTNEQRHYEDAAFNNLTRNFARDKAKETNDLNQSLADRGIPVGSEQYNSVMTSQNEFWGGREDQARNAAMEAGLKNWGAAANVGAGIRNQRLGETQGLSALGPGMQSPNFFAPGQIGFQAPDVPGTAVAYGGLENQRKQLAQQARPGGSGAARPRAPAAPASPFNSGPLPGT